MSILTLHAAIRAAAPVGLLRYDDEAKATPDKPLVAPWIVTGFSVPDLVLSEAVSVAGRTGELIVTIAALTASQANFIADQCDAAWAGFHVTAEGFTVGALVPGPRSGPYPAGLTATDTDLKYQVVKLAYRFTY